MGSYSWTCTRSRLAVAARRDFSLVLFHVTGGHTPVMIPLHSKSAARARLDLLQTLYGRNVISEFPAQKSSLRRDDFGAGPVHAANHRRSGQHRLHQNPPESFGEFGG